LNVGIDLAVGHCAVTEAHGLPCVALPNMQERFGLLLPVQPEHQLRPVTLATMFPDQVLDTFRQAHLVVVGKAS
jgi:hypothetical protein